MDSSSYRMDMYHGGAVDRPNTGSLWCRRWHAHVQVTRVYEHFIEQLDRLTADDVRWESYSDQKIEDHAPTGLPSLCWCDRAYWSTRKKLVFDVFIEDYTVHRVIRQFGIHQVVPVPVGMGMPDSAHAHSRRVVVGRSGWRRWSRGWRSGRTPSRITYRRVPHMTPVRTTSTYADTLRRHAPSWCVSSTLPPPTYQHGPTCTLYTSRGTCTSRRTSTSRGTPCRSLTRSPTVRS